MAWDSGSLKKKKTFWKEERWDRAGVFVGPESALRREKKSSRDFRLENTCLVHDRYFGHLAEIKKKDFFVLGTFQASF